MSSDSEKFCAKCIYYYGSTHVNWNTNDREYINTCKRKSDKVNIVTGEYPVRGTDCNIEGQRLFFLETKTESCTTSLTEAQLEELKKFVTNL